MKQLQTKLLFCSLITFLLSPPLLCAQQTYPEMEEGVFHDTRTIPGEEPQVKIDDNWYPVDNNSTIWICGKIDTQKEISDLTEFIGFRLNIKPSPDGHIFNTIDLLCE